MEYAGQEIFKHFAVMQLLQRFIVIGLLVLPTSTFALNINDLSTSNAQYQFIEEAINKKAFTLDEKNNFRPQEPVNRAAFLKAAFTYADYTPPKTLNNFTGYSDVPENSWFAPFVKKALEIRIYQNTGNNSKFEPDAIINRQEALFSGLTIFGIPAPLSNPKQIDLYNDIRPNRPYSSLFLAAKLAGIYFNASPNQFFPAKPLTRADAAELLYRLKQANRSTPSSTDENIPTIELDNTDEHTETLLTNPKFGIMLSAWSKIHDSYLFQEEIDEEQLVYGAIEGMVRKLGDSYSNFHQPNNDGEEFIYVPVDYEGIGAIINQEGDQFLIQTTITGSPASLAGIKSGDQIISIDGLEIKGKTVEEVSKLLKGKAGSTVKLRLLRNSQILNFTLIRQKINLDSVSGRILENQIIYLQITEFSENSTQEFADTLEKLEYQKYQKMIIDLRNDPGGYLTTTQEILNRFLPENKVIFYTSDSKNRLKPYYSQGPGDLAKYDIVVLINEGSASAAEIMAGALQEHDVAYLVGTTTYGKGTIQQIDTFEDNSTLKLTIAKWLTPKKNSLNKTGLAPDLEVKNSDQPSIQDAQLQAAINYLK